MYTFDDKERVENAAKELIKAVAWECFEWGGGEQQGMLDKVVEDCLKTDGDSLIQLATNMAHKAYLLNFIKQ